MAIFVQTFNLLKEGVSGILLVRACRSLRKELMTDVRCLFFPLAVLVVEEFEVGSGQGVCVETLTLDPSFFTRGCTQSGDQLTTTHTVDMVTSLTIFTSSPLLQHSWPQLRWESRG